MLVTEKFIRSFVEKYGKQTIYSDGDTLYPQVCKILRLKHYLHLLLEKSLIERLVQHLKRVESFDGYYSCNSKRRDCDNGHVYNWVELFVSMYNNIIIAKNNPVQ